MSGLAFTKDKNQIATPWHISEFLSELFRTEDKTVLDPTAGAGAMLMHAGHPCGIEYDLKAYEMLKKEIPNGDLLNASVFDCGQWIQEKKPSVVMMNPPFNCQKAAMPEEYRKAYGEKGADSTKGLYFVRWTADAVGSGELAAIVPAGTVADGNKAIRETKKEILSKHTLEAVVQLNSDLFYPAVAVSVVILFLKLGEPHSGKTWFADFSDDGLEKDRNRGRIDKNRRWNETKKKWIDLFRNRPSDPEKGYAELEVTAETGWGPHMVIRREPEPPTEEDFRRTVKDYMDWKIKAVGLEQYMMENPQLRPAPEERLKRLKCHALKIEKQIEELEREIRESETR